MCSSKCFCIMLMEQKGTEKGYVQYVYSFSTLCLCKWLKPFGGSGMVYVWIVL